MMGKYAEICAETFEMPTDSSIVLLTTVKYYYYSFHPHYLQQI